MSLITLAFMSALVAIPPPPETPLGSSIPPLLPHAISVSLPTWKANIGYEEGEKWVVEKMQTGYPRFFIHRSIQKVSFVRECSLLVSSA